MIYKILTAMILVGIAMLLGEWTGYETESYVIAIIACVLLIRDKPGPSVFEVTHKDEKHMRTVFEALEIAAWLARPSILLLDKYRPNWTQAEIMSIYESMNDNMASNIGPEKELLKYLHTIATVPMTPYKAFKIYEKLDKSRFYQKRAKYMRDTFINGAAAVLVRTNCPERSVNWYLINAHRLNIDPIGALDAIIMRYEHASNKGYHLALSKSEYPYDEFEGTKTSLPVPESLKNNDEILRRLTYIDEWRKAFGGRSQETEKQRYERIMKPIEEAAEYERELLMYG